jgi:hypothetical protein
LGGRVGSSGQAPLPWLSKEPLGDCAGGGCRLAVDFVDAELDALLLDVGAAAGAGDGDGAGAGACRELGFCPSSRTGASTTTGVH